jgi:hypothetical protein
MTEDLSWVWVTRHLGALEKRVLRVRGGKQFIPAVVSDASRLFLSKSITGNRTHVERFRELGLADLLKASPHSPNETLDSNELMNDNDDLFHALKATWAPEKDELITQRICAALGASRPNIEIFAVGDPKSQMNYNPADQEAWFLINFAWFHREAFDPSASIDSRLAYAMALGRLVEWWRSRESGLDRMAAGKKRSEAAMPKAAAERRRKASLDPPDWHYEAKCRVAELRAGPGRRSDSHIAKIIAKELEMSARQVSRVIKKMT